MKSVKTMAFIAVLAAVPACTVCGKVTASRDYVDEKVAQATNSVMGEIDGKLASATPADYETVSNRAMNAVSSVNKKTGAVALVASDVGAIPVGEDGNWTIGGSGKTSLTIGGSYIYPGELTVPGKAGRQFHVKEDGPYYGSCEINGSKILLSAPAGLSEYASMIEMPSVRYYDPWGDYRVLHSDILLNEVSVWGSLSNLNSSIDGKLSTSGGTIADSAGSGNLTIGDGCAGASKITMEAKSSSSQSASSISVGEQVKISTGTQSYSHARIDMNGMTGSTITLSNTLYSVGIPKHGIEICVSTNADISIDGLKVAESISFLKDNAVVAEKDYRGNRTAFAFGDGVRNSYTNKGEYSFAQGTGTLAKGRGAHAEGKTTIASGFASHAEGVDTTASGDYSHAEGGGTTASGDYSHAEGWHSTASGDRSHAGGYFAIASNANSYVWRGPNGSGSGSRGDGTFSIYPDRGTSGFFVDGKSLDTIIAKGSPVTRVNGMVGDLSVTANDVGAVPSSAANRIRAEYLDEYSNPTLVVEGGEYCGGRINVHGAPGGKSISMRGGAAEGGGQALLTVGDSDRCVRLFSPVTTPMFEEDAKILVGTDSTGVTIRDFSGATDESEGYPSIEMVSGHNDPKILVNGTDIVPLAKNSWQKNSNGSFVVGNVALTPGMYALANGKMVSATNIYSHAEGEQTFAYGEYSHAEGSLAMAIGDWSHAEGDGTRAIGQSSHAEGLASEAIGICSHAEGRYTKASASVSHSDGFYSHASNVYSYVWSGLDAEAHGADYYGSHGPGTYNINPEGGLCGLYIGNSSLSQILSNGVARISSPDGRRAIDAYGNVIDTTGYPGDFSVSNIVGLHQIPTGYTNSTETIWVGTNVYTWSSHCCMIEYDKSSKMWRTLSEAGSVLFKSMAGASIDDDEVYLYYGDDTNSVMMILTRTGRAAADTTIDKVAFESTLKEQTINGKHLGSGPISLDASDVGAVSLSDAGSFVSIGADGKISAGILPEIPSDLLTLPSNVLIDKEGEHLILHSRRLVFADKSGGIIFSGSSTGVLHQIYNDQYAGPNSGIPLTARDEVLNLIDEKISTDNDKFSNAVLAVSLNIDTNSVAVLNEIASTFGGFPIEGTATTVGGLLAALAAAIAWLKRNKADKADVDALAAKVGNANARLEEVA